MVSSVPGLFAAYVLLLVCAPLGFDLPLVGLPLVFGLVLGAFHGTAQALVLTRWIERPLSWVPPTAVGEATLWWALFATSSLGHLAAAVLPGLLLGLAQWLVLRRWVRQAGWWVLATTIGTASGVALAICVVKEQSVGPGFATVFALQVPLALITGIALITMFANTHGLFSSEVTPRPLGL